MSNVTSFSGGLPFRGLHFFEKCCNPEKPAVAFKFSILSSNYLSTRVQLSSSVDAHMSSTVRIICIALLLSMQKICAISNNNYGGGPSSGINPPTLSSSGGDSSNQAKLTQDRLQKEQLYEAYNLLHTLAQVVPI